MKATDLMVGDWVTLFDKYPARVDCIGGTEVYLLDDDGVHWHVPYSFIKPIPITPEILLKNGFKDIDKEENCDGYDIYWSNGDDGYSINTQDLHLHFVHELQHLLKVVGIEKEIEI